MGGMEPLRTALTELLGIDVPVLQSGMRQVAGPELAAEVSRAGGLGILAGVRIGAEELRAQIHRLRERTDRPFGVNLWLHPDLQPPLTAAALPEGEVEAAQRELNRFRGRLGLPDRFDPPAPLPDVLDASFEVILEERVPVWSIGLGEPSPE